MISRSTHNSVIRIRVSMNQSITEIFLSLTGSLSLCIRHFPICQNVTPFSSINLLSSQPIISMCKTLNAAKDDITCFRLQVTCIVAKFKQKSLNQFCMFANVCHYSASPSFTSPLLPDICFVFSLQLSGVTILLQ